MAARISPTARAVSAAFDLGSYVVGGAAQRAASHVGNALMRNVIVSPTQAIDSYHAGTISFDLLKEIMDQNGCFLALSDVAHQWNYTWTAGVMTAQAQVFSPQSAWDASVWESAWCPAINDVQSAKFRGLIDSVTATTFLRYSGVSHPSWPQLIDQLAIGAPSPATVVGLAATGFFDNNTRSLMGADSELDVFGDTYQWLRGNGLLTSQMVASDGTQYQRDLAKDAWALHWQIPSASQFLDMARRFRPSRIAMWRQINPNIQPFTPALLAYGLRANSVVPGMRDYVAAMSYSLPARRDVTRMLQTGAIARPEAVEQYQDLGYTPVAAGQLADLALLAVPDKVSPSILLKWMHAGSITPQQLATRLVKRGWNAADIAMLIDNSLKSISTSQIVKLYNLGLLSKADATARLVSDGWNPNDIDLVLFPPVKEITLSTVLKWYVHDYITTTDATKRLMAMGYNPADVAIMLREALDDAGRSLIKDSLSTIRDAYETGAISSGAAFLLLQQSGATNQQATLAMAKIQTEIAVGIVKQTVSTIRSLFLSGRINLAGAIARLQTAGVPGDVIARKTNYWQLEFQRKYQEISAQKTIDLLVRGIINNAEANNRLINLGYQAVDAAVLLASGLQDRQKAAAAAAAKASRTVAEQQRAAQALIRSQQAAQRQAMADLSRHGSPSQLGKWFKKKIITEQQFRRRLEDLGWPHNDIDNFIKQES